MSQKQHLRQTKPIPTHIALYPSLCESKEELGGLIGYLFFIRIDQHVQTIYAFYTFFIELRATSFTETFQIAYHQTSIMKK